MRACSHRTGSSSHGRPWPPPGSVDELTSRLALAPVRGAELVSADAKRELLRAAAEFIDLKARDVSPEEFASWRRARGYEPKTFDELKPWVFDVDEARASGSGPKIPPGASWDEVFSAYWRFCQERNGRKPVPVKVASTGEGIAVSFGWYSRAAPAWPDPPDEHGHDLSFFDDIWTTHPWWKHPANLEQQLEKNKRALAATVRFVAEFGDGQRRLVALNFVRDEPNRRWVLEIVSIEGPRGAGWTY